jgi:predicted transcriptional regulator with HTH domain
MQNYGKCEFVGFEHEKMLYRVEGMSLLCLDTRQTLRTRADFYLPKKHSHDSYLAEIKKAMAACDRFVAEKLATSRFKASW